jgi:aconitase A
MNSQYRKPLRGTNLHYFDAKAAVEEIQPGAWDGLPYTSRVLAENLVRRCEPMALAPSARPRWSTWPACATPSRSRAAIQRW